MNLHVLVVDTDADFARLLGQALGGRVPSLVARTACRADEALDLLARGEFHAAICSADLPDLDAAVFLERLRVLPSAPSVLFLLPRWDPDLAARVRALGARGVLEKPRNPDELLDALCGALCGEPAVPRAADFFRRLVENVPDVLYCLRLRPRPVCEYVSPAVAALTGYAPGEYYADAELAFNVVHPADRPQLQEILAREEPPAAPVVLRWRGKDGRTRWVEQRFSALRGSAGDVEAWEGIARDVTERHRVETCQAAVYQATGLLSEASALEEAAPRLLEVLGTCLDWSAGALWMPPPEGGRAALVRFWPDLPEQFVRLREAARKGVPEEPAGADPEWIPDLRTRPQFPCAAAAAEEGLRSAVRAVVPVGPKAGGALVFFARDPQEPPDEGLLRLLGSLGRQIGLFVLRRRAEEELQRLNQTLERRVRERTRELEEALEDVSTFAYTVAHDLRAPLRAMAGFSQALLEDYAAGLDPAGQDCARRIAEASRRMDDLIQDLLSYVRITQADLTARPERFEEAVDGALADLADEIARRRADVAVERPLGSVLAHGRTLRLVLAQILSNALKFVAPGTVPRIRVRAEPRGDFVRLWVEDNGIGIPPEYHGRIFGVFERLHRLEEYPGTGIGLALVRKAVERMQGRCGVESRPDAGSRFWIELPAAPL
ncbi:MAG TPA: ATP-binding protein [Planctomycetota bacterium]|nr:ATP-binding protein [Planctomycetota bacterium]